ncbi:MAG TPA: SpoIID/LytB domain-containing protein [Blastocatellia bacterium]|nr:SpoIID/LytB domain-containing protein [Blastocatellia bacterium]
MKNAFAIFALLLTAAVPVARAEHVRIGLFGLFRTEIIEVRIASGEGATLSTGTLKGERRLRRGDSVRVRLAGPRVGVVISDAHGGIKQSLDAREATVLPDEATALELVLPGRVSREVRGRLSVSPGDRQLRIVLTTDSEPAVSSVVAAEMNGEREPEAIKALAVVVRTYMLAHMGRHSDEGFDFCDTTHCQVYRGEADLARETASPLIAASVRATRGERLGFEGREIESYYTAACGGESATPSMVWGGKPGGGYRFRRVSCRWCRDSRYSRWERSAAASSVLDTLSTELKVRLSSSAELRTESDQAGDFVRAVTLSDHGRQVSMTSDEFRRAIGRSLGWNTVLSPTFTIERRGPNFIFRGRGFGSQIGLCLAGASAQAAAGRGYRDILSFYYPNSELEAGD